MAGKTKKDLLAEIQGLKQKLQDAADAAITGDEERHTHAANALMRLYALSTERSAYLRGAMQLLRVWSACRYVGIRVLTQTGEIPYESYLGFSREFWEAENWLSIHEDQCLCIRVITGQTASPEVGAMTRGGSFFTDNSQAFLAGLTPAQQAQYRGTCMRCGFKSIGIIPLVRQGKIIGIIHLADDDGGKMSLNSMTFLEEAGFFIGKGLQKFDGRADRVIDTHLGLLMERSRHRVSLLSPDGRLLRMNTTGYLLCRYDGPEALLDKTILDEAPEDRKAVAAALTRAAGGEEAGVQYRSRDQIGRPLGLEARFIPVNTGAGATPKILHIARELGTRR